MSVQNIATKLKKFENYELLKKYQTSKSSPLVKDELNPLVWNDDETLKDDINDRLLAIAEDFWDQLELNAEQDDIVLMGSLANYNWHPGSDFDVHIVFDYNQINQDKELVQKWLMAHRIRWNDLHDIYIHGFEVEMSLQDSHQEFQSAGLWSLVNREWISKPTIIQVDPENIEKGDKVYLRLAKQIDQVLSRYHRGEFEPIEAYLKSQKIWKKIKGLRKSKEFRTIGEYAPNNLAFKKLRTNGYLEKITNLKREIYDSILSITESKLQVFSNLKIR